MSDWWTGLEPAEIVVRCGGAGHRIRWEQGRLIACDHGDVEDERALAALGGERFACIELLDAWGRHQDDLRALTRAPRDISDPLRSSAWVSSPGARGGYIPVPAWEVRGLPLPSEPRIGRFPVYPRSWDDSEAELIALLGVGGAIGERLVATVAAHWTERLRTGGSELAVFRPRLQAALSSRLLRVLRAWLRAPELTLALEMIADGEPPAITRQAGRVRARLPFSWLVDVWAKGLHTVDDRLCLAAATEDGIRWRLTTLAADLETVERVTLDLSAEAAA